MCKQLLLFDPEVLTAKLVDGVTPGFAVAFDTFEADAAGVFVEHALDVEDARASCADTLTLEMFP